MAMKTQNKSVAQTFTMWDSDEEQDRAGQKKEASNLKEVAEFIVNVNTSAEKKSPHFSLTSACEILLKNQQHSNNPAGLSLINMVAARTEKSIAILELINNEAKLLHQISLNDYTTGRSSITFIGFVNRKISLSLDEFNQQKDNQNEPQKQQSQKQQKQQQQQQNSQKLEAPKSAKSEQFQTNYQNNEEEAEAQEHLISQQQQQQQQGLQEVQQSIALIEESSTLSQGKSIDLYVCFASGRIIVQNCMNKSIQPWFFNVSFDKENRKDAWYQKRITKIITCLDSQRFLVLFVDSTIIEYSLNSKIENEAMQSEIVKVENEISFAEKKFGNAVTRKNYNTFELSKVADPMFVGFACFAKNKSDFCGPNKYLKLKCRSISDFEFLAYSNPLYRHIIPESSESNNNNSQQQQQQLLAYCGLDGIFRVIDYENFKPIYSFQSNYGGINSFAVDSSSTLVSFSCQDDSILVLNMNTNCYWRILGHTSFVQQSYFFDLTEDLFRITAASLDGSVSATQFSRAEINRPNQSEKEEEETNNQSKKESLPIAVKFQIGKAKEVQLKKKVQVNEEAIAFLFGQNDYFMASSYDGCVAFFRWVQSLPQIVVLPFDDKDKSNDEQMSNQKFNGNRKSNENQNKNSNHMTNSNIENEGNYNNTNEEGVSVGMIGGFKGRPRKSSESKQLHSKENTNHEKLNSQSEL